MSTTAGGGYESETGRPQDQVFSSRRKVFHDTDSEVEDDFNTSHENIPEGYADTGEIERNTAEISRIPRPVAGMHDSISVTHHLAMRKKMKILFKTMSKTACLS